jgi:hypothetical protein
LYKRLNELLDHDVPARRASRIDPLLAFRLRMISPGMPFAGCHLSKSYRVPCVCLEAAACDRWRESTGPLGNQLFSAALFQNPC